MANGRIDQFGGALSEDNREATTEAIPRAIGFHVMGATAGNRVANGTQTVVVVVSLAVVL